jgi:hypothetical protein
MAYELLLAINISHSRSLVRWIGLLNGVRRSSSLTGKRCSYLPAMINHLPSPIILSKCEVTQAIVMLAPRRSVKYAACQSSSIETAEDNILGFMGFLVINKRVLPKVRSEQMCESA